MKNQTTVLIIMIGMCVVIALELLVFKYYNIVKPLDMKDVMIMVILVSFYTYILSQTLAHHPGTIRGQFTLGEKMKLGIVSLLLLPTVASLLVVFINIMA